MDANHIKEMIFTDSERFQIDNLSFNHETGLIEVLFSTLKVEDFGMEDDYNLTINPIDLGIEDSAETPLMLMRNASENVSNAKMLFEVMPEAISVKQEGRVKSFYRSQILNAAKPVFV